MLAFTSCLYFGAQNSLDNLYPRDVNAAVTFGSIEELNDESLDAFREKSAELADEEGAAPKAPVDYRYASFMGKLQEDGSVDIDVVAYSPMDAAVYDDMYQFNIIPLEDYNRMEGKEEKLRRDQALVYFDKGSISGSFLSFSDGTKLKATAMDKPESEIGSAVNVMPTVTAITDDFEAVAGSIVEKAEYHTIQWVYGYDTALSGDKEISYCEDLENAFAEMVDEGQGFSAYYESRIDREDDFYGMYGSLFFLGSMLSIVFIVAAVLIIYYKQVSEGYEDQSRFDIMQKVGMTARDIRKSINSQLLTVFFLPLCIAAIHLAFAFPLLNKMLMLFGLMDVRLLIVTTAISILVFALFYVVVYRITSNAYYKIVSGR